MKPTDIHRQLCEVYGEHAMSDSIIRRWGMMIHGVADRLWLMKIWYMQRKRRLKRTRDSSLHFPQISQSLLHKIVSDKLRFRKLRSGWVPMLTDDPKMKRHASGLTFLTRHSEQDGDFSSHIAT
jgi:hypothetical protein